MCTPDVAKALDPINATITGAMKGMVGSLQAPAMPAPTAGAAPASQAAQAAQAPDQAAMRRAAAALAGPSVQSTMLTGPNGVSPSLLNIGKTTLLGG